jgi:hypothetical protein
LNPRDLIAFLKHRHAAVLAASKGNYLMQTKLLIAGFMMAVALPASALAQPYDPGCVQSNRDNATAGTIVGALGGAILGGAIAGRHDRGAGVVVGGAAGALAGNSIARSNNSPCPAGYYYAPPPPPPQAYDGGRFWYGAPTGVHDRIDFMQDRINRAASEGWVSPDEIRYANRELRFIRSEDSRLHYQDGGRLRPEDRDYLQSRLDSLSQRLHWAEHNG